MVKAGQNSPELYTDGEHAFEKLVARDDLDLVISATPWDWHAEMAVAAMKHGKHAAVEVPAVTTIEDCWRLVDTSEETRRHCIMLENCCYGANETTVLRMTHAGLFGDLLYGEGAYVTICATNCSPTRARACGGAISIHGSTATSIPPTGLARWRTICASIAAIVSTTSCQ